MDENRLTVNIRSIAKESTKLNISADALREMREYTEDFLIPKLIRLSEKFAVLDGKKTIQERDYIRAKDFFNKVILELDEYVWT